MTVNPEVRARLDAHLDAVEKTLVGANFTRERRRGVVDDLEAQILDILAGKSEVPTVAELEEILGKLDPPAAYGEGAGRAGATAAAPAAAPRQTTIPTAPPILATSTGPATPARYSRTAIWGLVLILVGLLPLPVMAVGALLFKQVTRVPSAVHFEGGPEAPVFVQHGSIIPWGASILGGLMICTFSLVGPLTGTILGWIAFAQIRGSGGRLRGTGLALFDGLFYPAMLLVFSAVTPFFIPLMGIVVVLAGIAVIYVIVRLANGHRVFS
jgi:hypothetical protein